MGDALNIGAAQHQTAAKARKATCASVRVAVPEERKNRHRP
jgi:hypothetical protein